MANEGLGLYLDDAQENYRNEYLEKHLAEQGMTFPPGKSGETETGLKRKRALPRLKNR